MAVFVQPVDIGQLPNDGTGDPLRVAFDKLNTSVESITEGLSPAGLTGALQYKDANNQFSGIDGLIFDSTVNVLRLGINVIPTGNISINIGSANSKISQIFTDNIRIANSKITESGNVVAITSTFNGNGANVTANSFSSNTVNIDKTLSLNGIIFGKVQDYTNTAVPDQIIFEIPVAQFKSGVFEVLTVYEAGYAKESQSATIKINNNGIGYPVTYTISGTVFNRSPLTTYIADTGYGNVRLGVSPLYPIYMTHTISYTICNQ